MMQLNGPVLIYIPSQEKMIPPQYRLFEPSVSLIRSMRLLDSASAPARRGVKTNFSPILALSASLSHKKSPNENRDPATCQGNFYASLSPISLWFVLTVISNFYWWLRTISSRTIQRCTAGWSGWNSKRQPKKLRLRKTARTISMDTFPCRIRTCCHSPNTAERASNTKRWLTSRVWMRPCRNAPLKKSRWTPFTAKRMNLIIQRRRLITNPRPRILISSKLYERKWS